MPNKWTEVYPRPQLVRDDWLSLDGIWAFSTKKEGEPGMPSKSGSIRVPFCPESRLSGVRKRIEADDIMLYGTKFEVPEEWDGKRLIVHFGAVDQTAKIYVDGKWWIADPTNNDSTWGTPKWKGMETFNGRYYELEF